MYPPPSWVSVDMVDHRANVFRRIHIAAEQLESSRGRAFSTGPCRKCQWLLRLEMPASLFGRLSEEQMPHP